MDDPDLAPVGSASDCFACGAQKQNWHRSRRKALLPPSPVTVLPAHIHCDEAGRLQVQACKWRRERLDTIVDGATPGELPAGHRWE